MGISKTLLPLLLILGGCSTSIIGKYSLEKQIPIYFAANENACTVENGGQWDNGMCFIKSADQVTISKSGEDYSLYIMTVARNLHSCEYAGEAKLVEKDLLISHADGEEYNANSDALVKVECVVSAKFKGSRVIIENNDKCQSFCGANGMLETEAEKIKE